MMYAFSFFYYILQTFPNKNGKEWHKKCSNKNETRPWKGWTWVQAVLLWASRANGTHHSVQRGTSEQRTVASNHQVTGFPLNGRKWVSLNLNCIAPSVVVADRIEVDSSCMWVCAPTPSRRVSRSLSVNAANVRSLKFQHKWQGHNLTPLFLFTHSAWSVSLTQSATAASAAFISSSNHEWDRFAESLHNCNNVVFLFFFFNTGALNLTASFSSMTMLPLERLHISVSFAALCWWRRE